MIKLVRGFKDILPTETALWQYVEATVRELLEDFGFAELRIPILEKTELFARSIGAGTDIVEKEMYTFTDRKGDSLTLRPEATASVVRAYIEHKFYAKDPLCKLYTIGPMFRRERPQKGRYRQFYQINNSLGCLKCRPHFKDDLKTFLANRSEQLCSDCLRRRDENPLRIFDCKVPTCKETMTDAPSILDRLCSKCRSHFNTVQDVLKMSHIPYETNHRLVRGLDYYTRTTFEVLAGALGAQDAVAGGGRYDGLVKALGGPDQPGVGFAIGVDRLIELLAGQVQGLEKRSHLFIAALGVRAQDMAFQWVQDFRMQRFRTEMDLEDRSLKSQMRRADKLEASYVLIVGDRELDEGAAVLRNMTTKEQERVPLQGLVGFVVSRIKPTTTGRNNEDQR
jgi:histidyl-tRNA synthetase